MKTAGAGTIGGGFGSVTGGGATVVAITGRGGGITATDDGFGGGIFDTSGGRTTFCLTTAPEGCLAPEGSIDGTLPIDELPALSTDQSSSESALLTTRLFSLFVLCIAAARCSIASPDGGRRDALCACCNGGRGGAFTVIGGGRGG